MSQHGLSAQLGLPAVRPAIIRSVVAGGCLATLRRLSMHGRNCLPPIISRQREPMEKLKAIVDEQAEDEGLWFLDPLCSEAYLQAALRRLHAEIETLYAVSNGDSRNG